MKTLPDSLQEHCKDIRIRLADVGASGGLPELWAPHASQIDTIVFEPDLAAFVELERQAPPNQKCFNIGLHRAAGPVDFHITRKQTCSSCLEPNLELLERFPDHERFTVVEKTSIPCQALDAVLSEAGIAGIDFLKIDTQGSELAILEGAERVLRDSLFGLEVEVCFLELYRGQPKPTEVDTHLRRFGFDLIDLRTVTWKRKVGVEFGGTRGQLAFADALYFKQVEALRSSLRPADGADRLLRAVGVCLIYGYVDYALEIVDCCAVDHFSADEIRDLQHYVRAHEAPGGSLPAFPGRKGLSQLALWVHERLAPPRHRHSRGRLGNQLRM